MDALALVAIVTGAILISTRISELRRDRARTLLLLMPGVRVAIAASILTGLVVFGLGVTVRLAGNVLPTIFFRGMGAMVGFGLAPIFRQRIRPTRYMFAPQILAVSFFGIAGSLTFNTGVIIARNSLPIITALSGMAGAVELTYAIIILRERLELDQVIGVTALLFGVFSLLYFSA